jgi:hypothetical protein
MKQARMAKVLGCLVGAMTFGAAGLMWIEPHTAHLYPDAAVNGGGSYMLRAQPVADRSHWRGVLIEHSERCRSCGVPSRTYRAAGG